MNLDALLNYFYEYSLYSLLISFIVGILFLVLDKPLNKCPKLIKSYFPMLLCVTGVILVDYFLIKTPFSLKESFAVGVFSGSISYAVTSFFRKKEKGEKSTFSVLELSLTEILNDFTTNEKASVIAKEINEVIFSESHFNRVKIEEIIDAHLAGEIEPSEITLLKTLITVSVNSLKISSTKVNN